jgi:hypothetical protein
MADKRQDKSTDDDEPGQGPANHAPGQAVIEPTPNPDAEQEQRRER